MNLKPLQANMTELTIGTKSILFSYETAVAVFDVGTGEYLQTSKIWSRTTTRHINKWLDGNIAGYVDQDYFNSIVAGVRA